MPTDDYGSDGLTDEERAAFLEAFNNGVGSRILNICEHDWTKRDQGPGLRWRECWLCGEMSDYE